MKYERSHCLANLATWFNKYWCWQKSSSSLYLGYLIVRFNKLTSVFLPCHCQSSPRTHAAIASWIHSYFDNVMTKFIVNNRTDALKTDINLFFYDYKLSNCPLSLADASHEFQIDVSVRVLTINLTNERAWISAVIVKTKMDLIKW